MGRTERVWYNDPCKGQCHNTLRLMCVCYCGCFEMNKRAGDKRPRDFWPLVDFIISCSRNSSSDEVGLQILLHLYCMCLIRYEPLNSVCFSLWKLRRRNSHPISVCKSFICTTLWGLCCNLRCRARHTFLMADKSGRRTKKARAHAGFDGEAGLLQLV